MAGMALVESGETDGYAAMQKVRSNSRAHRMTERTAAEILVAQLTFEVEEAKRAVAHELYDLPAINGFDPATLETLIDRCVKRWWITRMASGPEKPMDPKQMAERRDQRMSALALCTRAIIERSGPVDPNALQVGFLGLSAELNALWSVLIDAALLTHASRQDYMDSAVAELYQRVHNDAQKVLTPGQIGGNGAGLKGH
jgi:hypothetical protein